MMKIRHLAALPLALLCAAAVAQVSGNGQVQCLGETAVLSVSASAAAADTGRPGAWFIAAHHPTDATQVAFLTPGGWVPPELFGYLVPYGEYPGGIPGSLSVTACIPNPVTDDSGQIEGISGCSSTSSSWAGYIVKIGYGVLTPEGEMLLASRRERLDAARPIMLEHGKWKPEYEDDDRMRVALIIKSLRDGRIADLLVVPSISCLSGS